MNNCELDLLSDSFREQKRAESEKELRYLQFEIKEKFENSEVVSVNDMELYYKMCDLGSCESIPKKIHPKNPQIELEDNNYLDVSFGHGLYNAITYLPRKRVFYILEDEYGYLMGLEDENYYEELEDEDFDYSFMGTDRLIDTLMFYDFDTALKTKKKHILHLKNYQIRKVEKISNEYGGVWAINDEDKYKFN